MNYQIVLYLFSRVAMALNDMLYERVKRVMKGLERVDTRKYYHVFAALIWGVVMWIF